MNKLYMDRVDIQGLVSEHSLNECEERRWMIIDLANEWLNKLAMRVGGDTWRRHMLVETVDEAFSVGWQCAVQGVDHVTCVNDGRVNECVLIAGSSERLVREFDRYIERAIKHLEPCTSKCGCKTELDIPNYD